MRAGRQAIRYRRMSTRLVRFFTLLTLFGLLSLLNACGNGRRSDAGPTNAGLRLQVIITSSRSGDMDVHHVSLRILNARQEPVTLTAALFGGPRAGQTYADFMASATRFSAYPVLKSEPFSIGGGGDLPQPTVRISGGGSTVAEWTVTGDTFTGYDSNHSLTLPMPGLYLLRAHLPVRVDDREVELWSNEAACSVGGSLEAPRKCSATIESIVDGQSVKLNRGATHGVVLGDRYLAKTWDVRLKSELRWTVLEVTAVSEWTCTAVARDGHPRPTEDPTAATWFPSVGSEVFLLAPHAYRR